MFQKLHDVLAAVLVYNLTDSDEFKCYPFYPFTATVDVV